MKKTLLAILVALVVGSAISFTAEARDFPVYRHYGYHYGYRYEHHHYHPHWWHRYGWR